MYACIIRETFVFAGFLRVFHSVLKLKLCRHACWRRDQIILICRHGKNMPTTALLNITITATQTMDYTDLHQMQGRNRKIFLKGQINFSWFFSSMKCFFPVENSHFGWPKTNFSHFEKVKSKKKKSPPHKLTCPHYTFHFYHLPFLDFPSFLLHFPFFPCLFSQ